MYYIVNGKKLDPNGRPVKDPPPNDPERPQNTNGENLQPGPVESEPEEVPTNPDAPITGTVTL